MSKSLYTRLAAIFISIALVSVIIISLISNISTSITFKNYVAQRQVSQNAVIINIIKNAYDQASGFNEAALNQIDMYAMMNYLNIKVEDINGNLVWNANYIEHSNMMQGMMGEGVNPDQGNYIENNYPILKDNKKIGTLAIGFNGQYAMSYHDISFMNEFNKWLIISGFVSVLIAFLLSILVSRKIANPIINATQIAHNIREGNLKERLDVETDTLEIAELSDTINHLAESLEEQEKIRRQLTSDVAHELRTPLATLQSHTEAILDGIWEPTNDRIESIHEEIVRISKLVKDIERLTAIENEEIQLEKTRFDVTDLITTITKNFEAQAKSKNIEMVRDYGESVELYADRDKMSQVIINLLSNALKYTETGGKITLGAKYDDEEVQITVKDTGVGIEKEHLPYIFERFYRVDSSRTRATGGAGIGLTITKSIVKAHGGDIKVISKKGIGTEFIISIPNK